jgi:hypothetical protein
MLHVELFATIHSIISWSPLPGLGYGLPLPGLGYGKLYFMIMGRCSTLALTGRSQNLMFANSRVLDALIPLVKFRSYTLET